MEIVWDEMNDRVVHTLQDLIRFDTTNPPGNETVCVQYLKERLETEGIPTTILESAPGRGNLVARLKGDGSARPLLLMSHVDVVAAEAERWSQAPFSGAIHNDCIWGRGAVDTKGLTAVELELMLLLKRLGLPLKRDVILAATADEETGGALGMGWLVENHFELIDAEYAINEGGGIGKNIAGHWVFLCQTAEKGICWTKLRARGRPGHASIPMDDTAVGNLITALNQLTQNQLPQHKVATVEHFVLALCGLFPAAIAEEFLGLLDPHKETHVLGDLAKMDLTMAALLRASLRNTAVPTILRAGDKVNVIPSTAEAWVDCRVLPGQTVKDAVAEMQALLGDKVELEVERSYPGTENDYRTPFFKTIKEVMAEIEPGSITLPFMVTGMTDGRYLANKGTKVYGFFPMKAVPGKPDISQLAHGDDERISIEELAFSTQALWEIIHRTCQG